MSAIKELANAVLDNTKQINTLLEIVNTQIPETILQIVDGDERLLCLIGTLNKDIEEQQKINRKIGLVLNNMCIQYQFDDVVLGHLKELVELVKYSGGVIE